LEVDFREVGSFEGSSKEVGSLEVGSSKVDNWELSTDQAHLGQELDDSSFAISVL
jgi:hypothetical protein